MPEFVQEDMRAANDLAEANKDLISALIDQLSDSDGSIDPDALGKSAFANGVLRGMAHLREVAEEPTDDSAIEQAMQGSTHLSKAIDAMDELLSSQIDNQDIAVALADIRNRLTNAVKKVEDKQRETAVEYYSNIVPAMVPFLESATTKAPNHSECVEIAMSCMLSIPTAHLGWAIAPEKKRDCSCPLCLHKAFMEEVAEETREDETLRATMERMDRDAKRAHGGPMGLMQGFGMALLQRGVFAYLWTRQSAQRRS